MLRGLDKGQRAALLISECQKGVIDPVLSPFQSLAEQAAARNIVPRIARLAQCFRDAELPVIHLHVVHRPGYPDLPRTSAIIVRSIKDQRMIAGSQDVLAVDELQPHPTDIVHARSFSLVAFHGTELDAMLRHLGVQTLVPVGVSTNVAISGVSLCGSDLGYQVVVPEDCIAGASAESHEFILRNLLPLYSTVSDSDAVAQAIR
ncbi:cysteine hydrolase family protein [Aquipseudomonas ullengensis]|uniref:Cysteine hydrolase n=1 Tax=Aquipseudomonas ullengensis TaxID=2759166 RepID=A0A7W4LQR7_9GAMM|nr:isochorismatase family cysteine hydrolase [Pseudomonas ullengensis]MBB2497422.1 cysteine hydrolase [Pseudomonas ullengensis]